MRSGFRSDGIHGRKKLETNVLPARQIGRREAISSNGALYDAGEYEGEKKTVEWRTYEAKGKLTKTTKHRA